MIGDITVVEQIHVLRQIYMMKTKGSAISFQHLLKACLIAGVIV